MAGRGAHRRAAHRHCPPCRRHRAKLPPPTRIRPAPTPTSLALGGVLAGWPVGGVHGGGGCLTGAGRQPDHLPGGPCASLRAHCMHATPSNHCARVARALDAHERIIMLMCNLCRYVPAAAGIGKGVCTHRVLRGVGIGRGLSPPLPMPHPPGPPGWQRHQPRMASATSDDH